MSLHHRNCISEKLGTTSAKPDNLPTGLKQVVNVGYRYKHLFIEMVTVLNDVNLLLIHQKPHLAIKLTFKL